MVLLQGRVCSLTGSKSFPVTVLSEVPFHSMFYIMPSGKVHVITVGGVIFVCSPHTAHLVWTVLQHNLLMLSYCFPSKVCWDGKLT